MATKSKVVVSKAVPAPVAPVAPVAPAPTVAKCPVCGKATPKSAGIGKLCAHRQTAGQTGNMFVTLPNVPTGYLKTALWHTAYKARLVAAGGTIAKVVKAFGGDRGYNALAHPICQIVVVGKARYWHPWLFTPAGITAIATGNFANAPKPPYPHTPSKK